MITTQWLLERKPNPPLIGSWQVLDYDTHYEAAIGMIADLQKKENGKLFTFQYRIVRINREIVYTTEEDPNE